MQSAQQPGGGVQKISISTIFFRDEEEGSRRPNAKHPKGPRTINYVKALKKLYRKRQRKVWKKTPGGISNAKHPKSSGGRNLVKATKIFRGEEDAKDPKGAKCMAPKRS